MRGRQLVAIGTVCLLVGGISFEASSTSHSECNSGLGQLGQAFSGQLQRDCVVAEVAYTGGGIGALAGVSMMVAGLVTGDRRRYPPAPGWYPDPTDPRQRRWWSGHAWTGHVHPWPPPASRQSPPSNPWGAP